MNVKYIVAPLIAGVGGIGAAYLFPQYSFAAFLVGWLFLIPAAFVVYMVYGLWRYMMERKHRITVVVKPTPTMKTIREESLKKKG